MNADGVGGIGNKLD